MLLSAPNHGPHGLFELLATQSQEQARLWQHPASADKATQPALEIDPDDREVDLRIGKAIGIVGQSIQRDVGNDFQHETVIDPSFPSDREILV